MSQEMQGEPEEAETVFRARRTPKKDKKRGFLPSSLMWQSRRCWAARSHAIVRRVAVRSRVGRREGQVFLKQAVEDQVDHSATGEEDTGGMGHGQVPRDVVATDGHPGTV